MVGKLRNCMEVRVCVWLFRILLWEERVIIKVISVFYMYYKKLDIWGLKLYLKYVKEINILF